MTLEYCRTMRSSLCKESGNVRGDVGKVTKKRKLDIRDRNCDCGPLFLDPGC